MPNVPIRYRHKDDTNLTTIINDEQHFSVGDSVFKLSELLDQNLNGSGFGYDWFCDLEIWSGSNKTGYNLIPNTDFTLSEPMLSNDPIVVEILNKTGLTKTVYSKIQITNASYQNTLLYFTYKGIVDNNSSDDINNLTTIVVSSAQEFTIGNNPGKIFYDITTSTSRKRIYLPLAASNKNLILKFSKADVGYGALMPTCQGSDKITLNGLAVSQIFLKNQYDHVKLFCTGERWQIDNGFKPYIDSGWINTNLWTNRSLGTVNLAVGSSTNFEIGEKVTGENLGTYGIIIGIPDPTHINLGWIINTGINNTFNNGEVIIGSNSNSITTVSGNFKNTNTNLYHGFNLSFSSMKYKLLFSTDKAEANINEIGIGDSRWESSFGADGSGSRGVDLNNLKIITGATGVVYTDGTGSQPRLTNQDCYYRVINTLI